MQDKILLLVRLIVETSHTHINEAIKELETETRISIPSTKNVKVLKAEILNTHRKS
jgi:hypothetical protein